MKQQITRSHVLYGLAAIILMPVFFGVFLEHQPEAVGRRVESPIAYRETGGARSYLHEIELPAGTTVPTVTGSGANVWRKVRVKFDYNVLHIPVHDLTSVGTYIPATVISAHTGIGQALYLDPNFKAASADADATTTMPGIGLLAESGTGSKKVLVYGMLRYNGWSWSRGPIYTSCDPNTSLGLTQTAPSGSGDQVQAIGWAIDPNVIFVQPDSILKAIP